MRQKGDDGAGCSGVLLVEDDRAVREMVALLIRLELDVAVCEAEDGAEALRILDEETPNLVVTDVGMPGVDGIDLVRRLRRSAATAHLPVLVISASTSSSREAIAAGADAYLEKPFDVDDFLLRIRVYLACEGAC